MATNIHPLAVVDATADIAPDAIIEPFAHIGPRVAIGARTRVRAHAAVVQDTAVGADCDIHSFASVGGDPQDLKFKGERTRLEIGDHNIIRECATVNRGTGVGGGLTRLGHHNMIMAYAHIAHDCHIGNGCVITNAVQLAGHIVVEDMVIISGAAAVHHFVTIGTMAFVAGMTAVRADVPPYVIVEGNPGRVRKLNTEGLKRRGVAPESHLALQQAFKRIYRPKKTYLEALRELRDDPLYSDPMVARLVNSCLTSSEGLHGRALEKLRQDENNKSITMVMAAEALREAIKTSGADADAVH